MKVNSTGEISLHSSDEVPTSLFPRSPLWDKAVINSSGLVVTAVMAVVLTLKNKRDRFYMKKIDLTF